MQKRSCLLNPLVLAIPVLVVAAYAIYRLPPVHDTLSFHLDNLRTRIIYAINPPDEATFLNQDELAVVVQATLRALTPSPTIEGTSVPQGTPTSTAPPTVTPTPLPERVVLDGVVYVDQHNRWNYCGPANLTMALKFWGWEGDRDDVAAVVKPGVSDPDLDFIQRGKPDKNVMPYELAGFVVDYTEFNIVARYGGDMNLLKTFIANGLPVLIEKAYYERTYTGEIAWLGHYLFVTGYDEAKGVFIVQDAYLQPGEDLEVEYDTFFEGWRPFDYIFMVVYPPDRESEVYALLGPWADPAWADQHALEIAIQETNTLTEEMDLFFAWFNVGTSQVNLLQYAEAAAAYDYAFFLYNNLPSDDTQRPYRIMWYQTGPYWAYYYSGQYQDVIDLANTTLYDTISEPTLEESLYWRGRALEALGDLTAAIEDYRQTVYLNPNFAPGLAELARLGLAP